MITFALPDVYIASYLVTGIRSLIHSLSLPSLWLDLNKQFFGINFFISSQFPPAVDSLLSFFQFLLISILIGFCIFVYSTVFFSKRLFQRLVDTEFHPLSKHSFCMNAYLKKLCVTVQQSLVRLSLYMIVTYDIWFKFLLRSSRTLFLTSLICNFEASIPTVGGVAVIDLKGIFTSVVTPLFLRVYKYL